MNNSNATIERPSSAIRDEENLRVIIIEPRNIFKECLSHYLSQFSGVEAFSIASLKDWPKVAELSPLPDIILLCVAEGERLPADLSEVLPATEELQSLPVVVLSNERLPCQVFDLLKAGVRGFIPTNAGCAVAIQVLRLVRAGGTYIPTSCLSAQPDKSALGAEREDLFTGRQKQVIEAIRLGKPNKIIAYELNMCESTVKVHVRAIMKKLKANNRTQVAHLYSATLGNTTNVNHERYLQVPEANNLTGTS
jgi:DNA-binding NarL/FixJ family response regulator